MNRIPNDDMRRDNALPKRKNIRLPREIYGQPGLTFFITICTDNKHQFFADESIARFIYDSSKTGSVCSESDLLAFCIMPDHVHFLMGVTGTNLIDLIGRWKSYTRREINRCGMDGVIWERSFYDHALRKDEDVEAIAQYIIQNPVRKGLVDSAEKYPFSWHKWMEG